MKLRVANLRVQRGSSFSLDVSFTVESGEGFAILGPNGAGKTTILLCIAGFIPCRDGSVLLDEKEVSASAGSLVTLIPEIPVLFPMLTVAEHLEFVALNCALARGWRDSADLLVKRMHLEPFLHMLGSDVSKGVRQKTLIAASLLADVAVMLFDEPMVGLDPQAQRELLQVFDELKERGKIVIVSTHALDVAERFSNRFIIIKDGRIAASGTGGASAAADGARSLAQMYAESVG